MPDDAILRAIASCNPNEALEPDDPRFVDLDDLRGFKLRDRVVRLLQAEETRERYAKVAVVGHRGSGKSTELNRTQSELRLQGYETLWASVNENLDPRDISFSDVMRLLVLLLDDAYGEAAKNSPPVSQAFKVVEDWFREVTKEFSERIQNAKDLSLKARIGGGTGAEGSVGIAKFKTDLGELSAALSVVRLSESSESTKIKETLERYNSTLVENVNILLRSIRQNLRNDSKLVFILDNVDKYEPSVVNQAFLRHSDLLQQLDAHLIFTLQSSLLYKPVDNTAEQSFKTETLPMLPVFQRHSRKVNQTLVDRVRTAVYARVPKELFAGGDAAVDELIPASGGCWRDLLRLLQEALLNADVQIEAKDLQKARQLVAQTYQRLLRSEADLDALAQAHLNHVALSDDTTRYLLHHLCLLFYNGAGWYDMHPLLDNYAPVAAAVQQARQVK